MNADGPLSSSILLMDPLVISEDTIFGETTTTTTTPTPTATTPRTMEEARGIYDRVSQTIFDDVDQEEELFRLQPTPIGSNGRVVVVSQLSVWDDVNLFDSNNDVVDDFLDLLSSDTTSASAAIKSDVTACFNNKKNKRHYYKNKADPSSSCDAATSGEPVAKKPKTFSINVSPARATSEQQPREEASSLSSSSALHPPQSWNKWDMRLEELVSFKQANGHCRVPNIYPENTYLAQWVKRQRYQYKLKVEGKHSTLSDERQQILDCVGFVWDAHECVWMERWNELKKFFDEHGHSHVPTNYEPNRQLSIWVKCQRRQYKLYQNGGDGGRSNMTEERVRRMESLKFNWNPRNLK